MLFIYLYSNYVFKIIEVYKLAEIKTDNYISFSITSLNNNISRISEYKSYKLLKIYRYSFYNKKLVEIRFEYRDCLNIYFCFEYSIFYYSIYILICIKLSN